MLVVLTLLTGLIWLVDWLLFRTRRMARAEHTGKKIVNEPAAVEYSRSLFPVLNNKFLPIGDPQRGDVVVFRHPNEPGVNLIKRLIGLPGDRVVYRNKQLTINGEVMTIQGSAPLANGDLKCSTPRRDAVRYREDLGGKRHDILLHAGMRGLEGEWVVPEGHYFMMGDNRDQSNDSRGWGFAPEENIMGRAVATWLNFDFNQGCADWGRVGEGIE